MKLEKILSNTHTNGHKNGHYMNGFSFEEIGDNHLYTGIETPMKPNAFAISDEEKKKKVNATKHQR